MTARIQALFRSRRRQYSAGRAGTCGNRHLHQSLFRMPLLDGTASIAIELLLAVVAEVLIWEILGLLIGEGVDTDTAYAVRDIVENDAVGAKSGLPSTMYPGPEEVPMTLAVEFKKTCWGNKHSNRCAGSSRLSGRSSGASSSSISSRIPGSAGTGGATWKIGLSQCPDVQQGK